MPLYSWEGRTQRGDVRRGTAKADSETALRAVLRKDNLILLRAREQSEVEGQRPRSKQRIKTWSVVLFTRQLATMIAAGLPLVQSLGILAKQIEDKRLKPVIRDIKERIEGGSRFADALKQYPGAFDNLFVNLVVAGEEGGSLDTVLLRLAVYLEKTEKLKQKVKSATIYPASIIVVAIAVVLVLLIFVIPVFESIFKEVGAQLPGPTLFVVQVSKFVKGSVHWMIGLIVVLVYLLRRYHKTDKGGRQIDRIILKIPIFGVIALKASIARVTRTLATLLSSGVAILESMTIVAKTAGNRIIEDALLLARAHISEGKSMSEPLEESKVFPPMVVQMVQVGESTGALDTMLNKVADFYEEDVDNMISNLTSLLEPAIMVFLGVILGTLLVAMYLPIFKLGTAIG